MRINNNDNISFGTNIKVVSPKCFSEIMKKMEKNNYCENINTWDINSSTLFKEYLSLGFRENMNFGYTCGVRSCTAGVTVKKGKEAPLFWHISDTKDNLNAMPVLESKLQGDNAVIVGSKDEFNESRRLCNRFQKALNKKSIPTTILKPLTQGWQAALAYTSKNDTLYLCLNNYVYSSEYVKSIKDLKNICKIVKISPTDSIEFLGPIKEFFISKSIKL